MAAISHLMSNGIILLKRPYISLIIATRGLECENNLWEVMAWESFPISDFDPFFSVKRGHLTTKALYLPYFSYITDPKAGDNCCDSGLIFNVLIILYH